MKKIRTILMMALAVGCCFLFDGKQAMAAPDDTIQEALRPEVSIYRA